MGAEWPRDRETGWLARHLCQFHHGWPYAAATARAAGVPVLVSILSCARRTVLMDVLPRAHARASPGLAVRLQCRSAGIRPVLMC